MADYRCYVLNKEDRVYSRHDIKAENDADAIIRAGSIALIPMTTPTSKFGVATAALAACRVRRRRNRKPTMTPSPL